MQPCAADWQCPACGICYAKFQKPGAEPIRASRETYVQAEQGRNLGWLFKAILLSHWAGA